MHDYCCRLPEDFRLWPSVGNGHISMVVRSENIFMNGLYNGYLNESHRAAVPCPLAANVTQINNQEAINRTYVLNIKAGILYNFQMYFNQFCWYIFCVTCNVHLTSYCFNSVAFYHICMLILQVFFKNLFLCPARTLHWSGILIACFFRCWYLKCQCREQERLPIHCILVSMWGSGLLRVTLTSHMCHCQRGVVII